MLTIRIGVEVASFDRTSYTMKHDLRLTLEAMGQAVKMAERSLKHLFGPALLDKAITNRAAYEHGLGLLIERVDEALTIRGSGTTPKSLSLAALRASIT